MEECKWVKPSNPPGVPVWSHAGIVCTGETYKQVVKLTFARGASLEDPRRLFNSSLEGSTRRAIDIREGEVLDAEALTALIQAAVAENLRSSAPKSRHGRTSRREAALEGVNLLQPRAQDDRVPITLTSVSWTLAIRTRRRSPIMKPRHAHHPRVDLDRSDHLVAAGLKNTKA